MMRDPKYDPVNRLSQYFMPEGYRRIGEVDVHIDYDNKEILIEKNKESVLLKDTDIDSLVKYLIQAKELMK